MGELVARIPPDAPLRRFDRDQFIPGDEPEGWMRGQGIAAIPGLPPENAVPLKSGDTVYDLVWVDDFHLFLGRHTHSERLVADAGNIPALTVPASSPSRAWL